MTDSIRSVFHHPRHEGGSEYEQNVTKHLLTVLHRVDDDATRKFWEQITGSEIQLDSREFEYGLEVTPDSRDLGQERYLVGISRWGESFESITPSDTDARADGLISLSDRSTGERDASLVLEVKTGDDSLGQDQLNRYQEQFGIPRENCFTTKWTSVYNVIDEFAPPDGVGKFLRREYMQYLRREQLRGTVAKITDTKESEEQSHLQKEIRVRNRPDTGRSPEVKFWGTYYDPETEAPEQAQTYTTAWMCGDTFSNLLDEIDVEVRREVFVDLIESESSDQYPAYNRLREWANNGGYGGDDRAYKGNSSQLIAETEDENGGFPELRFVNDETKLRFGRITANNGSNRHPFDLVDWEFDELIGDIDDQVVREKVFVDGNLSALWDYYVHKI
jgi:hypothetical protein